MHCNSCSEEENTRDLFINLKVIGQLEADQKLNTKERFIDLDESTWYQWAIRKYRGDSRENTISKLNKIVDQTKHLLEDSFLNIEDDQKYPKYLNLSAREFLIEMNKVLSESVEGLKNLIGTYNYDTKTKSQIEMGLIVIRKYISEIKNL